MHEKLKWLLMGDDVIVLDEDIRIKRKLLHQLIQLENSLSNAPLMTFGSLWLTFLQNKLMK